jgi:IclR family KDG regulon transcriptional repressor
MIMDKVDSPTDVKVSSEAGMGIPLLAGAGGKVLLAQLSDMELDSILSENKLVKFTPLSCVNKKKYKQIIKRARQEGFAMDDEEYIEGIRALAVPLFLHRENLEAALWIVGLKSQMRDEVLPRFKYVLKDIAKKIETRLWNGG